MRPAERRLEVTLVTNSVRRLRREARGRHQPRGVQGGGVPSRHKSGPVSRFTAAGSSSCEIALPATQPDIRHAAATRLAISFTVAPTASVQSTQQTPMRFIVPLSPSCTIGLGAQSVSRPVLHTVRAQLIQ
jgi:hypothetical protein